MKVSPQRIRRRAWDLVRDAVKRNGTLREPTSYDCIDCGEPAKCFDHRDYTKPLQVDPVCYSCNTNRGHGYPLPNGPDIEIPKVLKHMITKSNMVKFRLSDQELTALRKLAKKNGVGVSDLIRGWIRRSAQRKQCW